VAHGHIPLALQLTLSHIQAKAKDDLKRIDSLKQVPRARPICTLCSGPNCSLPAISRTQLANALPRNWVHRADQGFALQPIPRGQGSWDVLAACLQTRDASWLGKGRDVPPGHPPYRRLVLARAWRVENPKLWRKYGERQREVAEEMRLARQAGGPAHASAQRSVSQFEQPPENQLYAAAQRLPGSMRKDVNETRLLHGTKPASLLPVLSGGPNERYSGGIFGPGTCKLPAPPRACVLAPSHAKARRRRFGS